MRVRHVLQGLALLNEMALGAGRLRDQEHCDDEAHAEMFAHHRSAGQIWAYLTAMSEPSVSNVDLRASRARRYIFAGVLVAALGIGGFIIFTLATAELGVGACRHLVELAKTEPLHDTVIDNLQRYVESNVVGDNLVDGHSSVHVSGTTPDERCRSAIDYLDRTMGHGPFTRMLDCMAAAQTGRAATQCF